MIIGDYRRREPPVREEEGKNTRIIEWVGAHPSHNICREETKSRLAGTSSLT